MLGRRTATLALGVLIAALARGEAAANEVRLHVSDTSVTLADTFDLRVVVTAAGGEIEPPSLDENGFEIVNSGRSTSIKAIFGKRSAETTFTYRLRPTRTGAISIPPVSVRVDGKTHTSEGGVTVHVEEIPKRDDFILELEASKTRVYVDEQIVVTLRVLAQRLPGSNADIDPFASRGTTWPHLQIPWVESHPGFETADFQQYAQTLNPRRSGRGFPINSYSFDDGLRFFGDRNPWLFDLPRSTTTRTDSSGTRRSYFVYTLSKTFRAVEAGTFQLAPVTARGVIFTSDTAGARPTPNEFLTQSNGVTIEVREVPRDGRPPSFTGAVGKFTATASLAATSDEIWVGEPITLEVTIRGTGRLESIGPLSLKTQEQFSELFRVHDEPQIGEIDPDRNAVTFVYGVRPRRAGFESIPGIRFSYFDPELEQFVTIETPPIPVTVREGRTVGSEDVRSFDGAEPVRRHKRIKSAIYPNYIRPDALEPQQPQRTFTAVDGALLAVPPLLYLALLVMTMRRRRLERDPGIVRKREAGRRARAALEQAMAAASGRTGEAFDGVARALTTFVADRLGLPASGLTAAEALAALEKSRVASETRAELRAILETCEQARYGAAASAGSAAELGARAREALRRLEAEIR